MHGNNIRSIVDGFGEEWPASLLACTLFEAKDRGCACGLITQGWRPGTLSDLQIIRSRHPYCQRIYNRLSLSFLRTLIIRSESILIYRLTLFLLVIKAPSCKGNLWRLRAPPLRAWKHTEDRRLSKLSYVHSTKEWRYNQRGNIWSQL